MTISATQVRELRERTGASMMDCKRALEASGGDMEQATDHLRKQGLKAAAKKAERTTGEGRIVSVISADGRRGHLVAVACETDFLAKGEPFQELTRELAEIVETGDPDGLDDGERPLLTRDRTRGEGTVSGLLQEAVANTGENVRIAGFARLQNDRGRVGAYVHHDGKKAAIASITTGADPERADQVLKGLCQHVVVFTPEHRTREDVPAELVERERTVLLESDELKSKPEQIREKIVAGRMDKFFATAVLEEQPWIHEEKLQVAKAIEKELGAGARVEAFARLRIA